MSSKKKSTPSVAEAGAELAAAVVSRIERPGLGPSAQNGTGEAALVATASAVPTSTLLVTGAALPVAPNILSIAHWDRLLGGALYAPLSRVDWATLLRRTFDVDVTRCTGCAGRMTVRAVVTDPASINRLLAALRRSRDPPRRSLTSPPIQRATRRAVAAPCLALAKRLTYVQRQRNLGLPSHALRSLAAPLRAMGG